MAPGADVSIIREAQAQFEAYFAGKLRLFDLPMAPAGTPFQQDVWRLLCEIAFGQRSTYGQITAHLGLTREHARAVGTAVGRNPISIAIPCHRVVGADGALTGYAGGLPRKAALRINNVVAMKRIIERGVGIVAIKVFGNAFLLRTFASTDCVRFALSLPLTTMALGFNTIGQLEDNVRTAQNFTNHGDYDVYVKKNPVPKVTAPKSNQMSVLDNPTTKVRTFDGGNYDATEWDFGKGAYIGPASVGNAEDKISSFEKNSKIPSVLK